MDKRQAARTAIKAEREPLIGLSAAVHELAETLYEEHESCALVAEFLEHRGFNVERNAGGLATAFKATYGSGSLNVGICAEYDALPNIGHACGHNIIAAAAVGAAIGLQAVADTADLTVTVLGTPAEEGGAGKTLMLQAGVFDGLHAAMMVHPYADERDAMGSLAVSHYEVKYFGTAAHAAAHPEDGVSASAALALAQTGIAFLREHMVETDRVHGIVEYGGDAPGIVPNYASGRWFVRALTETRLEILEPKVLDVFRGAALMTGCRMELIKRAPTMTEVRTDERLAEAWRNNAKALGRVSQPLQPSDAKASTDMGNVSFAMPTIHPLIRIDAGGANIHQEQFAAAAINESAHQAVVDGAVAMAWTVLDVADDPKWKSELTKAPYSVGEVSTAGRSYLDEDWQTPVTFDPAER